MFLSLLHNAESSQPAQCSQTGPAGLPAQAKSQFRTALRKFQQIAAWQQQLKKEVEEKKIPRTKTDPMEKFISCNEIKMT